MTTFSILGTLATAFLVMGIVPRALDELARGVKAGFVAAGITATLAAVCIAIGDHWR